MNWVNIPLGKLLTILLLSSLIGAGQYYLVAAYRQWAWDSVIYSIFTFGTFVLLYTSTNRTKQKMGNAWFVATVIALVVVVGGLIEKDIPAIKDMSFADFVTIALAVPSGIFLYWFYISFLEGDSARAVRRSRYDSDHDDTLATNAGFMGDNGALKD